MTKNDMFVGKGYCNQELFILNVFNVINNGNASTFSAYIVESYNLWHARLGHVSVPYIQMIKQLGLIKNLYRKVGKREVCIEAKLNKKSHKSVQ